MSDNSIEKLDLSALDNLEVVQCTKNQLQEISLNGRSLLSLVADWNSMFIQIKIQIYYHILFKII